MERNLDEDLKMAQIKNIDQMIAESFATVEKMREDSKRADKEYEESKRRWEQEREERKKEWEQEKKESEARVAKYNAEREKALKETKYLLFIATGSSVISAIGIILHLFK